MDFEVVNHKQTSPEEFGSGSTEPVNETGHGSANLKHQRSGLAEDSWKSPKMPRPGEVDFSSKNRGESFSAFGRSNLLTLGLDGGQKMLSFSSSGPDFNGGMGGNGACRTGVTGSGVFNEGVVRGVFARSKGSFTPSQWMELEHQSLIYQHIMANVPVPSNLLLPIKKSLYSYGSYTSNLLGWGPLHLGISGSNDPEPGRCRRTDGKKWRCSRDSVPDQKYCERHINRGKHRSRKLVEGQNGHFSKNQNVVPIASSLELNTANASAEHLVNRKQVSQGLSLIPPTIESKLKDMPFESSSHSEFGLVSSDSLVNPSEKISYMNSRSSDSFLGFNDKEANDDHHHYPVHHFIDDWPKDQSNRASISWPEKLDWTRLSLKSIPVSTSPAHEQSTMSSLRLSNELDSIHTSLGSSHGLGEPLISWGNSMGGPLGEVLTTTTTCAAVQEKSIQWRWCTSFGEKHLMRDE